MIDRQMQQMTRLIDDLLDISRITRNKLELRREPVELAEVLRSAVETSRPLIEACGHQLVVTVPLEPIGLDADPTRLAQAISNLLNNAAKYTNRGGTIRLGAERQGREVVVSVLDTGIGIPPEMLSRVFEMFTQVQHSSERAEGGLGIGLTLVKRLVEMHGGSVEARSEGPGKGSEFLLRLPIDEPSGSRQRAAGWSEQGPSPSGLRLLVVDDNPDVTASLELLLRILGNDVRTARDGAEALEAAEQFRPDVILLDLGLPERTGYEVAREIRRRPWGTRVTLIAVTGWGQAEERRLSREAGFDHHLVKPVVPGDLTRLLASLQGAESA
jgi:CheY-like chemotaxis protein/anti-sigma regulatory factor (Ser/Thr protein kinase)